MATYTVTIRVSDAGGAVKKLDAETREEAERLALEWFARVDGRTPTNVDVQPPKYVPTKHASTAELPFPTMQVECRCGHSQIPTIGKVGPQRCEDCGQLFRPRFAPPSLWWLEEGMHDRDEERDYNSEEHRLGGKWSEPND